MRKTLVITLALAAVFAADQNGISPLTHPLLVLAGASVVAVICTIFDWSDKQRSNNP